MATGQNLWYHIWVDEHGFTIYFDIHQGYRVLTHIHIMPWLPYPSLPSIRRQLHRVVCAGEEPRQGAVRRRRRAHSAAGARGVAAEAALGAVQGDAQGTQFVTWGCLGEFGNLLRNY